jgi:hypothetical protein
MMCPTLDLSIDNAGAREHWVVVVVLIIWVARM